jgi:hypothetical protein
LKDGQIKAEYRQPFGTAALMKEVEKSEKQEAPSFEGASAKWPGWRNSNPRLLRSELPDSSVLARRPLRGAAAKSIRHGVSSQPGLVDACKR